MIAKLDGNKVLKTKQGLNTEPAQTMGATINNIELICKKSFTYPEESVSEI